MLSYADNSKLQEIDKRVLNVTTSGNHASAGFAPVKGPSRKYTYVQFVANEAKQETHTSASRWQTAVIHKQSKSYESRTAGFCVFWESF